MRRVYVERKGTVMDKIRKWILVVTLVGTAFFLLTGHVVWGVVCGLVFLVQMRMITSRNQRALHQAIKEGKIR
jgi:hypothetical protein